MHYHDGLWKGLLQAFFPQFLELMVPDAASRLRLEDRRFLEQEALFEPPKGQRALLDLLAEVPARDGPKEVILVHVEVERAFGQAMDRRMWRFSHLSLKYEHAIVPIVLFLRGGQGGVTKRHVDFEACGHLINRFTYWSLGLSTAKAEDLLAHPPIGVALASCARGDRIPLDELKLLCLESLLEADVSPSEKRLLVTAVETYLQLNKEQEMKYAARVEKSHRRTEVKRMELTWAGKLHEKGREVGRQEGVELGRQEGVELGKRMLLQILEKRFGRPPLMITERIRGLEEPVRIEEISDRALAGSSLAEIEELLGD